MKANSQYYHQLVDQGAEAFSYYKHTKDKKWKKRIKVNEKEK